MFRWTLTLAPALAFALGGCIVYDNNGKCPDCEPDEVQGDHGENGGGENGDIEETGQNGETGENGETGTDPAADMKLELTPNVGTVGTTFIAHLTSDHPDFDWHLVSDVSFYGGVVVVASEPEATELLLTLNIPSGTLAGPADLLVATSDGRAFFVEDALLIEAGNGGGTDTGDCP